MAFTSVVGRVTSLDLSHVTVGHTSCSLNSSRIEALAQSFAVGENLAISCAHGVLQTIKLAPLKGPGHAVASVGNGGPSAAAGSLSCSSITRYGSASGPITCMTAGSVTIGEVTCPITQTAGLRIGEVVSISCASGPLVRTSQIEIPNS